MLRFGQAYVTATVTVWDDDEHVADECCDRVPLIVSGEDRCCWSDIVNDEVAAIA